MNKTFVIILFSGCILLPQVVGAQGLTEALCDGPTCSACHLGELGNRLIQFIISLAFMLFAVLAVIAGFRLVTSQGNPSALQDAKDKFTNVFIGLLIVLSAAILVDTLIRGISDSLGGNVDGFGPWATIQCMEQADPTVDPGFLEIETTVEPEGALNAVYSYVDANGFITTIPVGDASLAGGGLTDAQVKALLDGATGIDYKDSVSGEGLKPHVIDELINLRQACGCDITITSLTDGNHASGEFSHANGFKADIRSVGGGDPNPELIRYVESLPAAGQWKDGTKLYYDAEACATYAMESSHIDVQYKTGC